MRTELNTRPSPYNCLSRYCEVCGAVWQRDQRTVACTAAEHVPRTVALITVTAPGAAYFRDDDWQVVGGHRQKMEWWNAEARSSWRELHLWASRPVRGWASKHAPGWRVLFRSGEFQKRGLLHVHLVLPYSTPAERRVTDLYVWNLWSGARAHDFGYVMAGDTRTRPSWAAPPRVKEASGADAALYVCKYIAGTGAGKEGMRDVAKRTAQRGSVLYVSRTLSQLSGVTMAGLRARRRIWARYPWARGGGKPWRDACAIDALSQRRAPLADTAVLQLRQALSRTETASLVDAMTGEELSPTRAPEPPQEGRTPLPWRGQGRRLVCLLAPVLLRDPQPGSKRIDRTVVVSLAV